MKKGNALHGIQGTSQTTLQGRLLQSKVCLGGLSEAASKPWPTWQCWKDLLWQSMSTNVNLDAFVVNNVSLQEHGCKEGDPHLVSSTQCHSSSTFNPKNQDCPGLGPNQSPSNALPMHCNNAIPMKDLMIQHFRCSDHCSLGCWQQCNMAHVFA